MGDGSPVHLRLLSQALKDEGFSALPQRLRQIIAGLAGDGRDGSEGRGGLTLLTCGQDPETVYMGPGVSSPRVQAPRPPWVGPGCFKQLMFDQS